MPLGRLASSTLSSAPKRASSPPLSLALAAAAALTGSLSSLAHGAPSPATAAAPGILQARDSNPLVIELDPTPAADDGPAFSANALRNHKYLPAQIGGIVAAYGLSLVLVAITLLLLSKKRRKHLEGANEEILSRVAPHLYIPEYLLAGAAAASDAGPLPPTGAIPNFSYPSPVKAHFDSPEPSTHVRASSTSAATAPGVDLSVDQRVVQADREMAQQQLEEMYRHVMEHEDAKQRGIVLDAPVVSGPGHSSAAPKKERSKPASLKLGNAREEKTLSKASSFFSALRSPRKKPAKGVSISSPIMTPQSTTFPRHEPQEMAPMTPRLYAPPPPPPLAPADQTPLGVCRAGRGGAPPTPDMSPESAQSIDERITAQLGRPGGSSRRDFQALAEADPDSAASEHSQVPLVGLPSSPKFGPRSPTLPASPKPGATFQRPNPPSAVREGGALPLRAYEPAMASPSAIGNTTKQTVFERRGPLSPTTGRTPRTAGAVPYSPYQPFTPVVPMTPSLVTKEDRKRMKKMVPKTPTMEMVRSTEEMW